MSNISLVQSTGNQQVDRLLRRIVGIYSQVFSTRLRAFYIMGSYADNSAVPLSDIDLCIIFRNTLTLEESEQAQMLAGSCEHLSAIRLDISISGKKDVSVPQRIMLKRGSLLIYGEDIRDDILLSQMMIRSSRWKD